MKNIIRDAYLMADGKKLETKSNAAGVMVRLPKQPIDNIDTAVVLKLAGSLAVK